jgi:predicted ATP-grasp superfamily ATP-dependent carboligase
MEGERAEIKEMFEKIVLKENPKAKYWYYETSGYHIIDMPRNQKLHGSSVGVRCDKKCEAVGDIIVYDDRKIVEAVERMAEKAKCKSIGAHVHGLLTPEAHIHLECKDMSLEDVKKLMELVKWF